VRHEYDPEVHALYIHLRDLPYAFGENLDQSRRIDYAIDRQPIGIELLNVHRGVRLARLPEQSEVSRILERYRIKALA
jgi:uncharacterized protein YuzE